MGMAGAKQVVPQSVIKECAAVFDCRYRYQNDAGKHFRRARDLHTISPQGLDACTFETNQRKPSRASALRNLEGICSTDQAARLAASAVHVPATCLVATLKRFHTLILPIVMISDASPASS